MKAATTLQCSEPSCELALEVDAAEVPRVVRGLKEQGWTVHPGYLRCPKHTISAADVRRSKLRVVA